MAQMASYEKPASSTFMSDQQQARNSQLNVAVNIPRGGSPIWGGGGGDVPAIDYASAILACAKAYYETSLMKDWCFTLHARFMLKAGGMLCPGRVLSVTSEGGELMGGYVVGVSHTISVSSRTAHTRIVCTHPRFGALPDGISGENNPLYS